MSLHYIATSLNTIFRLRKNSIIDLMRKINYKKKKKKIGLSYSSFDNFAPIHLYL